MRTVAILTTLALALSFAAPVTAQDKQDKDNRGPLGVVLDTLGNVLGTGTQKLHGTVVLSEDSNFVLRTDDGRTYRVDTASLDPQKIRGLTPGQGVSITARGGGQAGVLAASDVAPDAKGNAKTYQSVSGTVQEASRDRVLFKTRDGLVLPVDVGKISGLPYLAANQPATLYYEQGSRQELVGVWIQPGASSTAQHTASTQQPSSTDHASPSASVPSASSLEGVVQSIGMSQLTLETSGGRTVTVNTSSIDRQAMRAIAPGDTITVTGNAGNSGDRFVAQSVQPRR